MKTKLFNLWRSFRTSYWFVPTVMAVISIALSLGTTTFDAVLPRDVTEKIGWLYSGGPEGARSILSTVAGSMITTAGVVFSITIVVLSLTSSQFGPRLLGNFIRDTGTQVVLGTFIASFIYCLLTLRVVRSGVSGSFVPHLSISIAFLLAVVGTVVLIYFIHHVSTAIQADSANNYKLSKQPDVLMLFYLFSAEEIGDLFGRLDYPIEYETIPKNIAYYVSRTSYGSTLSRVVYAWVLARSDRPRAMEYFAEALQSDVSDVQQGTTAEGVHLGAMAGTVDQVVRPANSSAVLPVCFN